MKRLEGIAIGVSVLFLTLSLRLIATTFEASTLPPNALILVTWAPSILFFLGSLIASWAAFGLRGIEEKEEKEEWNAKEEVKKWMEKGEDDK